MKIKTQLGYKLKVFFSMTTIWISEKQANRPSWCSKAPQHSDFFPSAPFIFLNIDSVLYEACQVISVIHKHLPEILLNLACNSGQQEERFEQGNTLEGKKKKKY